MINVAQQVRNLQDNYYLLANSLMALRRAQKAYMKDRGNQVLGKAVGQQAKECDVLLEQLGFSTEDISKA